MFILVAVPGLLIGSVLALRVTLRPGDFTVHGSAKFSIGQLVHHRLFGYRGVIHDVDPVFLGEDDWYDQVAQTRPPKDQPWYRVLVDGADHETYVAERNLEPDHSDAEIKHPAVAALFETFEGGVYIPRRRSV